MKSQREAADRSIGCGRQSSLWRRRSPRAFAEPALTRRVRDSQLSTALRPAALSGSFTVFEPLWAKRSLRVFVSAENFRWSKVDEEPLTLNTLGLAPLGSLSETLAATASLERIGRWP